MFRYEVFLCVADCLNFTKAAQSLQISQPAVSKHISELEKEFGLALFHREKGAVRLTGEGLILKEKVIRLLDCKRDLERTMQSLKACSEALPGSGTAEELDKSRLCTLTQDLNQLCRRFNEFAQTWPQSSQSAKESGE